MTGWGREGQNTCRTNGKGPEIYSRCAFGSVWTDGDAKKIEHHKTDNRFSCKSGSTKSTLDVQCRAFNEYYSHEVCLTLLAPSNSFLMNFSV